MIYTLSEIESVVSSDKFAIQLIDAIQEGFVAFSQGNFNVCPIQTMGGKLVNIPVVLFDANTLDRLHSTPNDTLFVWWR